jgi:hypothetical protein
MDAPKIKQTVNSKVRKGTRAAATQVKVQAQLSALVARIDHNISRHHSRKLARAEAKERKQYQAQGVAS